MPAEYGCFMVNVDIDEFENIQKNINEEDLDIDNGGFETEQHITIKFGIANDPSLQVLIDALYSMN